MLENSIFSDLDNSYLVEEEEEREDALQNIQENVCNILKTKSLN